MHALSKQRWLKILTALFVNEICTMNDGQPFLETARLTSSYMYDFLCTFSLL